MIESTHASEVTPLHVNTSNNNRRTTQYHSYNISNERRPSSRMVTVDSSLTATTYESSSTTLHNDEMGNLVTKISNNASQHEAEPDAILADSVTSSRKQKIKATITLCILVVGLTLCLLTLVQYPINVLRALTGKETNASLNHQETDSNTNDNNVPSWQSNHDRELFDEIGRYIIHDYDALPPFSDFLPVRENWVLSPTPIWTHVFSHSQFHLWL